MTRRMNRIRQKIVTRAVAGDSLLVGEGAAAVEPTPVLTSRQAMDILLLKHIAHQAANPGQTRRRQILGWLFDLSTKDT